MSTRCTIKYGDDFHLYHECFDNENVYLRLDEGHFEVSSYDGVTVVIPNAIWNVIREADCVDLSFAEMSDVELELFVEKEVDERIDDYNKAPEGHKAIHSLFGAIPFGMASDRKEVQMKNGMKHYKKIRASQAKTLKKIQAYKKENK